MLTRTTRWGASLVLAALVLLTTGAAQERQTVAQGTDYFQTLPGTFFNFGVPIGTVDFMGNPPGINTNCPPACFPASLGATDTIVQRQADAVINGPAIPLQIVALSLESTAPVNVGGSFFDVFVTLDPANLSKDTGMMSIMGSTAGGTFNSFFDVFFDAHFVPVGGGTGMDIPNNILLSQNGAAWSPTAPPGALLISGPFGNQNANIHTGLPPGEVDFWPVPPLVETHPGGGTHVVQPTVPEPSSLLLLGPSAIGLLLKLRARRAARA